MLIKITLTGFSLIVAILSLIKIDRAAKTLDSTPRAYSAETAFEILLFAYALLMIVILLFLFR